MPEGRNDAHVIDAEKTAAAEADAQRSEVERRLVDVVDLGAAAAR